MNPGYHFPPALPSDQSLHCYPPSDEPVSSTGYPFSLYVRPGEAGGYYPYPEKAPEEKLGPPGDSYELAVSKIETPWIIHDSTE